MRDPLPKLPAPEFVSGKTSVSAYKIEYDSIKVSGLKITPHPDRLGKFNSPKCEQELFGIQEIFGRLQTLVINFEWKLFVKSFGGSLVEFVVVNPHPPSIFLMSFYVRFKIFSSN